MSEPELDLDALIGAFEDTEKEKDAATPGKDPRILKLAPAKAPYKLRLLPNMTAGQLIVEAWVYEWQNSANKYVWGGFSPKTFDLKVDLNSIHYENERDRLFGEDKGDQAKRLFPIPYKYVNVLVLHDPNDPENEGEIRVLRYRAKPFRTGVEDSGSPINNAINEQFGIEGNNLKPVPAKLKEVFNPTAKAKVLSLKVKKSSVGFKYETEFEAAGKVVNSKKLAPELVDITELFDVPFTNEKQAEVIRTRLLMQRSRVQRQADEGREDEEPLAGLSDHQEESPTPDDTPDTAAPADDVADTVAADLDKLMQGMGAD